MLLINIVLEVLASAIRQSIEIRVIKFGREKTELPLSVDYIIYIKIQEN